MSLFGDIFKSAPSRRSSVVGIDIGSSSMKVVELKDKHGVVSLTTYGEIQLGPYARKVIGESVSLEPKQEQEALVDIIREAGVNSSDAVFAMPLSSSFVTNVSLNVRDDADLSAMVRVEARKVIPTSLSEVTLDWAEVEMSKKDSKHASTKNILIASIQNSALERFNTLMRFANFSRPPSEIECFSTIRGLYNDKETNIAIIDIGAVSSKLYIAKKGLLMRMYRIRAGGALVTKQIADDLGIDFKEAEDLKLSTTKESSEFQNLKRINDTSYDRAFREFGQVIREHENKTGSKINSIYLSGGGALFPGLDAHLRSALDREVLLANPFAKVAYPAFMEDNMLEIGPSFTVALGAALRVFE